jgi:hypothetical protein
VSKRQRDKSKKREPREPGAVASHSGQAPAREEEIQAALDAVKELDVYGAAKPSTPDKAESEKP